MADTGIALFLEGIANQGHGLRGIGRTLALELGLPYEESREGERVIEHRHDGMWVEYPDDGGKWWDHGKTWAEENTPDSYNNVDGALARLKRPVAIWAHGRSMNLVFLDADGTKVGVRSTCLLMFLMGAKQGEIQHLLQGLRDKLAAIPTA